MSVSELKKYILKSKYARYNKKAKRRENYSEAVNRVRQMMLDTYPMAKAEVNWAYDQMEDEIALGSQRAMQFGGDPIKQKNERIYNCCATYADRLRFFQEAFFLLLCGSGTGFSVQKHHVGKLPSFARRSPTAVFGEKIFVVPDTIEGWADSLGVLISSYFEDGPFPEYCGYEVVFDFSLIRPKGSYLSSGAGRAPGPEPLKRGLEKIRELLNRCVASQRDRLRPIDVYDIVMHASDAVLAGGVRRSATICVFSPDDYEMATAKIGDWFKDNPQRARSNNSVLLVRGETSYEKFAELMGHVRAWGEPGMAWADSTEIIFNPCTHALTKLLTPYGIRNVCDVKVGDKIWSKEGWTTIIKKWSTGTNKVYRYGTTAGVFYGTSNHRIVSYGIKIPVDEAEFIDIITGPLPQENEYDLEAVIDGLVLGDGTTCSDGKVRLIIGKDDQDYFTSDISSFILDINRKDSLYKVKSSLTSKEVVHTYNRRVPDKYIRALPNIVCSFLRGIYSANGSVCGKRVTLKSSSKGLIEDVQLMLSSIGIKSYYTTNKATDVKFKNGIYTCKESYDLNISVDRDKFKKYIGFIHSCKMNRLDATFTNTNNHKGAPPKTTYSIIEKEHISTEETFDITVDNSSHTYWTQGCDVSNCMEIGFFTGLKVHKNSEILKDYKGPIGYDSPDIVIASGWASCNLSTVNGNKVKTKEDFYKGCAVAAAIGTFQASFTHFPYLGKVTEEIVRREALLGVSITSIMSNPEIMLDPEVLQRGAEIVLETNERIANLIGINVCARGTCIKPEGTGTLMLGSLGCGAHAWPFRKGIKNVQANREEVPYQWLRKTNPQACEPSVWCQNKSTDVISFPIEAPPTALIESDHTAVQFLSIIKSLYENWVVPGKRPDKCTQPWLSHSVSNTVKVKDHEWDEVTHFIYDNRSSFAGVSLLAACGDRDYEQAPNIGVYSYEELEATYGGLAVNYAQWLVPVLLEDFNGRIFDACNAVQNTDAYSIDATDKISVAYVHTYVLKETGLNASSFCLLLKDIVNWEHYCSLKKSFREVDYESLIEYEDTTRPQDEAACAGGACLI